jgi:hypothetical protein
MKEEVFVVSESLHQAIRALAELDLKPGESQRVQVNGYYLEVRRPREEEESPFADMVMLVPWADFPSPSPGTLVPISRGELPLPVPPEIPDDSEDFES